jgi:hypothetical protein
VPARANCTTARPDSRSWSLLEVALVGAVGRLHLALLLADVGPCFVLSESISTRAVAEHEALQPTIACRLSRPVQTCALEGLLLTGIWGRAFDLVFGILVRMLVTLPVGWLIYAFGFAAKTCDSLLTAQCLTFALGAPIGYLARLGLAVEEPPDYPEDSEVWFIALAGAISWMAIDVGVGQWRRKKTGR